jgi:hypothetical protein
MVSSVAPAPTSGRATTAKQWGSSDLPIFLIAGLALGLLGLMGEYRSPVNGDVAWLLYLAQRSLAGARPYVDLFEMNPPLVIWLNTAILVVSEALRIDPIAGYRLFVLATVAWSMAASAFILPRLLDGDRTRTAAILLAQWVTLLPMPAGYFGEREHLALAVFYPYLLATASEAVGRPLHRGLSFPVGVTAAIGLCLKPHFVLLWVAMTLYERQRTGRLWWRLTTVELTALATLTVYGVAVLLLAPEYLELVARLGGAYQRFSSHSWLEILTRDTLPLSVLLALAVYAGFRRTLNQRVLPDLLAVAVAGFLLAVLLQGKGFGYHYLTPVGTAIVLMAVLVVLPAGYGILRRAAAVVAATCTVAICLWPFLGATIRRAGGELSGLDRWTMSAAAYVRARAPGQSVGVLSARLTDAFPLMLYSGSDWAFRFPHLWFVPVFDTKQGRWELEAGAWCRRIVAEDLARRTPTLLLVREYQPDAPADIRNDYVKYLSQDPLFAVEFSKYDRVDDVGELAVYRRRGGP